MQHLGYADVPYANRATIGVFCQVAGIELRAMNPKIQTTSQLPRDWKSSTMAKAADWVSPGPDGVLPRP